MRWHGLPAKYKCDMCGKEKACVARRWSQKQNCIVRREEFEYDEAHRAWICRACREDTKGGWSGD